jgi:hypothetical protein
MLTSMFLGCFAPSRRFNPWRGWPPWRPDHGQSRFSNTSALSWAALALAYGVAFWFAYELFYG